ncbi:MAG: hypothetical protein LBR65_06165 [Culturomica sp.]|nr:hypothetical protein [Culturomica sp.]
MKIEGFAGYFENPPVQASPPASSTASSVSEPALKTKPNRPSASFKLKEAFQNTASPEAPPSKEEFSGTTIRISGRDPFDADRVSQLLDVYIAENNPEIAVSIGLKAHDPAVSGEEITIRVDNRLQLEKTEALKKHIQNMLMQRLNNGSVKLAFLLNEEEKEQDDRKLITSQDKLEFFIRRNPAVLELKKVFGLELD